MVHTMPYYAKPAFRADGGFAGEMFADQLEIVRQVVTNDHVRLSEIFTESDSLLCLTGSG